MLQQRVEIGIVQIVWLWALRAEKGSTMLNARVYAFDITIGMGSIGRKSSDRLTAIGQKAWEEFTGRKTVVKTWNPKRGQHFHASQSRNSTLVSLMTIAILHLQVT